jgi:hypothetical protein
MSAENKYEVMLVKVALPLTKPKVFILAFIETMQNSNSAMQP